MSAFERIARLARNVTGREDVIRHRPVKNPNDRSAYGFDRPLMLELMIEYGRRERPDLVEMCNRAGVEVRFRPMGNNVAGHIDAKRSVFHVNSETSATRRRFTLAHQAGHWMWHRNLILEGGGLNDDMGYRQIFDAPFFNPLLTTEHERQASLAGINLIMDADVIRRLWNEGLDPDVIADRLEITRVNMDIRARNLRLDVAA